MKFFIFAAVAASFVYPLAAVAAEPDSQGDGASVQRGAQAWSLHCGRCHSLRQPKEKQDYEWDIIVDHMRLIANLPGPLAADIKAFLKASN